MITVESKVTTKQLSALIKRLEQPGDALNEIGAGLQQSTRERITTSKVTPSGRPFAPWSFATLKARQADGSLTRGILYKTGVLANSIQFQVENNQVQVGADESAPYARYLQFGTTRMPARPFIGFSQQDIEMIRRVLRSHIRKA